MIDLAFYGFAALALVGALLLLFTRNVLYGAFFLLLTLLGVAALFVLASADFLAVAQLMIYVGGVLVLIIFGVMFTSRSATDVGQPAGRHDSQRPNHILTANRSGWWALLVAGGLFAGLYALLVRAHFVLLERPVAWQTSVDTIGRQLMTEYLVPFEIAGVLLLAALVGAAYIARPAQTNSQNSPNRT